MQSSFEVLEWESTSKAQDSLVHQLFGDISSSIKLGTCSAVLETANQVNASKAEKRKALKNEESTAKLKKKRKDKRQKNKFKQVQVLSSEHSETTISKANGKNVNLTVEEFKEPVLVSTNSEISNGHDRKTAKKKKRNDEIEEKDVESKKGKKNVRTYQKFNSQLTADRDSQSGAPCDGKIISAQGINQKACIDNVNQLKESVDTTALLNADIEKIPSSFEGPNKCDSEKVRKRKKREKRKLDQNGSRGESELLDMGESTSEVTHEHKKRKKTHKLEQDSCCDKQISKHSPEIKDTNSSILSSPAPRSKSSLQEKMTKQLESSRFRWINEQLYTTTGDEAVAMFSKDPKLFDIYHRGFTNQVKLWPVNPVNKIIEWLKKRSTSQVVADFGCGEAIMTKSVANKVHSFDLVAKNELVTACNMAKVPISSASVDVAVFCLSLMGTNLVDFLREAHRVLKPGGILKVAEVASRINDTAQFTKSLARLGFKLQNEDATNKMFVMFDFIKSKESVKLVPSNQLEGLSLKPCIYKKR